MIRTLLVDDHPVVAMGVASHLKSVEGVEFVGSVGSRDELRARLAEAPVDVLILDIQIPGVEGFELLREVVGAGVPTIVFSLYATGPVAAEALRAGAHWTVSKGDGLEALTKAVHAVGRGQRQAPAALDDPLKVLSRRELEIFRRIVAGFPLKVIAIDLGLSTGTVHTYAHRIRSKLGVETIPDLVRLAHRMGFHLVDE